ncbi:MAG TPA: hypothetical protein VMT99_03450 [Candidatus Paceibacterota bacterium]|nr:hypothetical protein [Candidatus Paceibacterota bacterium]
MDPQVPDPVINILGLSSVGLSSLLVFIVIAIIVFLICREFITWYWKITEIVESLEVTNERLDQIAKLLTRIESNTRNEKGEDAISPAVVSSIGLSEREIPPQPDKPKFLLVKSIIKALRNFKYYKKTLYAALLLLVIGVSLFALGSIVAPIWRTWMR